MKEMRFNCPLSLSARYWAMCVAKGSTAGEELREMMKDQIAEYEEAHGPLELRFTDGSAFASMDG